MKKSNLAKIIYVYLLRIFSCVSGKKRLISITYIEKLHESQINESEWRPLFTSFDLLLLNLG